MTSISAAADPIANGEREEQDEEQEHDSPADRNKSDEQ
jgi:hypothetical protein